MGLDDLLADLVDGELKMVQEDLEGLWGLRKKMDDL